MRRRRNKAFVVSLLGPRAQDMADVLVMVRSLASLDDGNRTQLLVLYENNSRIVTRTETLELIEHAAAAVGRTVRSAQVDLRRD